MKRYENWCNVSLFMCRLRQNLPLQQTCGNLFLSQFTEVRDSSTFVSFSCIKLKKPENVENNKTLNQILLRPGFNHIQASPSQ